jgi:hypothetical protein
MSNPSERSLRTRKRAAQASETLCSMGQIFMEAYRRAAIEWGTNIEQGASNETVKQLASEHFRALSEFSLHRVECARCGRSSVEKSTLTASTRHSSGKHQLTYLKGLRPRNSPLRSFCGT